jgi:hypothetical protein
MTEKPEFKEKAVRIVWDSDEDLPALYSNHLYISHSGETEFHLVFGHLSPPITVNLEEDELPEAVMIKPVAKIVISPKAMEAFIRILNDNYEKFKKLQKGKKNE